MRNYEKFSDNLDGKILDFNLKSLGFVAAVLLRPLAICTQAVFRKNFGERYFNGTMMTFSLLLFGVAELFTTPATAIRDGILYAHDKAWLVSFLNEKINPLWAAGILSFIFTLGAANNLLMIRQRQQRGEVWYSMSRGESVLGSESESREVRATILSGGLLLFVAPSFGILFIASRMAAGYLFLKERQSNYARYLDYMDAQILAGKLEPAMIGNQSPRQTSGLYCPLPKQIKGEQRARVARISADVLARSAAGQSAAGNQSSRVASSIPDESFRPPAPEKSPAVPSSAPRQGAEANKAAFIAPRNLNPTTPEPAQSQQSEQIVPMNLHSLSVGVIVEFSVGENQYKVPIQNMINNFVLKGLKVTVAKPDLNLVVERDGKVESVRLQEIVEYFATTKQQA